MTLPTSRPRIISPDALRGGRLERTPPGQALTAKWPVLHYGSVPKVNPRDSAWSLRVCGRVEEPYELTYDEIRAMSAADVLCDMHCVTHWSRLDNHWSGVAVPDVMAEVRLRPAATHVVLHAFGGWTTNLPLEDFLRPENLFATHHDDEPLTAEHGAPVRLVVPHLYFWKSAKWIRGVEVLAGDRPGFWEQNGYHMRGDPWKQQRYGGFIR